MYELVCTSHEAPHADPCELRIQFRIPSCVLHVAKQFSPDTPWSKRKTIISVFYSCLLQVSVSLSTYYIVHAHLKPYIANCQTNTSNIKWPGKLGTRGTQLKSIYNGGQKIPGVVTTKTKTVNSFEPHSVQLHCKLSPLTQYRVHWPIPFARRGTRIA